MSIDKKQSSKWLYTYRIGFLGRNEVCFVCGVGTNIDGSIKL